MPCMHDQQDLLNCTEADMQPINKYRDETAKLLKIAYEKDPTKRVAWAPACSFHCWNRFGLKDEEEAGAVTVPANSENTIGYVAYQFIFKNISGSYIDNVVWPENQPCYKMQMSLTNNTCNIKMIME